MSKCTLSQTIAEAEASIHDSWRNVEPMGDSTEDPKQWLRHLLDYGAHDGEFLVQMAQERLTMLAIALHMVRSTSDD